MILRVACQHGICHAHGEMASILLNCPGGREPTVEEVTQWLKERGYVPLDVQTFGETWARATAPPSEEET